MPARRCAKSRPKTRALLSAERAALNFLQLLSGTAKFDAQICRSRGRHPARSIVDTRKTLPGLRLAQKYAVHLRRRPPTIDSASTTAS
jgi:nicotinate-nucleotide pyrophosphorylase (carboxylating)